MPGPGSRCIVAFFFAEDAVMGEGLADTAPDQLLGCQVGFGNPVEKTFRPDIEILPCPIRQSQLPGLDGQLLGKDAPLDAIHNHDTMIPTTPGYFTSGLGSMKSSRMTRVNSWCEAMNPRSVRTVAP